MNTKTVVTVVAVVLIVVAGGCLLFNMQKKGGDDNGSEGSDYVTDALGRHVIIPNGLDGGIVTIGSSGALRFASMFDVYDYIIEVDKGDITDSKNGRAYSYAFAYDELDPNTQSHPDSKLETATLESIVNKRPSLVITMESVWNGYVENFTILAKQCTVVVLKDQQMKYMTDADGGLAEYFEFNVNLLGKLFGRDQRASEIISGIEGILDDIESLSGTSKTRVYVAGVTISGSNTLNTTFPTYMPFSINGITNAYNLGSTDNKAVLTVEDFTKLDIDMIVVDPSSSDKIMGNQDSQHVLEYLYGLNNDSDPSNDVPIYITVPIVWDSINYDCALASVYYTSYLVYGNLTLKDVEEKIDHIFEVFYGEEHSANVFDDMREFFVGKSSSNGQEMPVLGEVKIAYGSGMYSFISA